MTYALGVDLGTTYTAAAVSRDDRVQMVALGAHGIEIPSVVAFRDSGEWLTGDAAVRRAMTEPARVAREFKRRFGDSTPLLLGGSPFGPDQLAAVLLRAVLDHVRVLEDAAPASVAVTHPANWGPFKLDLLRQTVALADMDSALLVSEPEAAATYYASIEHVGPGAIVAVYDLGGGTFDVAVLRKTASGFEILGEPQGIERLGGIDFDEAVFGFVSESVAGPLAQLAPEDPAAVAAVARLRAECIAAKEALSSDTDVTIPVSLPNASTEVRLTRSEFEAMIRPSLTQTVAVVERTLRLAHVAPQDLTKVLLVGGSSRIPLVAEVVGTALGRPVAVDAHPKHAVALGAALVASAHAAPPTVAAPVVPPPPATEPAPAPAAPRSRRGWVVAGIVVVALLALVAVLVSTRSSKSGTVTPPPSSDAGPRLGDSNIVFTSDRSGDPELYTLDVDTGATEQLTHDPGFDGVASIAPDRRHVAYLHSPDPTNNTGPRTLVVMDADGGDRRSLGPIAQDGRPSWSPDGAQIVFPSDGPTSADLSIIPSSGGAPRTLVTDDEKDSDPNWSPDGRTITYTRDVPEQQQIWAVAADGSGAPRLLIDDQGAADADWSHDGRFIVYDGQRHSTAELAVVNADGNGRRTLLSTVPFVAVDPFWSPDDQRVVFRSDKDGNDELYVINVDGSGLKRVTFGPERDILPAW